MSIFTLYTLTRLLFDVDSRGLEFRVVVVVVVIKAIVTATQ